MPARRSTPKAPTFPIAHAAGDENRSWGHLYDVTFAAAPTPAVRMAIATAFENAIAGKMRLDPEGGDEWRWREATVTIDFAEGASVGDFESHGARAFFLDIERAFVAIDKIAKLARVETADDFHGTIDPDFEAARHGARDAIAAKASAATETAAGIRLVLVKTGVPTRPEIPPELVARFSHIPRARRARDGTWFLIARPVAERSDLRAVMVVEPDGTERTSALIPYGQFDALAVSPDGTAAIVTTNLSPRSTDRHERALVSEVARASAQVSPVGEVMGVGANLVCELAWIRDDRIVVLTEDRVTLFDRSSWKPLAKARCGRGSEIAVTASGRYVLIACAQKKIHARLFRTTGDALHPIAEFTENGRPWSSGDRLFLSAGRRDWEVLGLE